jgi:hypothetical protein
LSPSISSLSNNCHTENEEVSILGQNFGSLGDPTVSINGSSRTILSQTQDEIRVQISGSLSPSNPTEVTVNGQLANSFMLAQCNDKLIEIQDANLSFNSATAGLFFKSPNGQCWKIYVDNNGKVVSQFVSCQGD